MGRSIRRDPSLSSGIVADLTILSEIGLATKHQFCPALQLDAIARCSPAMGSVGLGGNCRVKRLFQQGNSRVNR